jgi:hypothetical protein
MVAAVVAAKETRGRARRSINLVNTREAMTASGAKRPLMAPEPVCDGTSRWLSMDIGCREGIRYFPF